MSFQQADNERFLKQMKEADKFLSNLNVSFLSLADVSATLNNRLEETKKIIESNQLREKQLLEEFELLKIDKVKAIREGEIINKLQKELDSKILEYNELIEKAKMAAKEAKDIEAEVIEAEVKRRLEEMFKTTRK